MKIEDAKFYKLAEGEKIEGEFIGVTVDPFPAVVLNDGNLWLLPLAHSIKKFLMKTKLPGEEGIRISITFNGQIPLDNGRKLNQYSVEVDETTLPESYDTSNLKLNTFGNPAEMSKEQWDKIENLQKKQAIDDNYEPSDDELPF